MSNETTYSLIQSWLPDIVEAAEMYLQQQLVMPSIVTVFNDKTGLVPRRADKYAAGTVGTLTEGTLLNDFQAVTREAFGTLTPAAKGAVYMIGEDRIASDSFNDILADLSEWAVYSMAKAVETDLLGAFTSFAGGTVGAGGSVLTWQNVYDARSILAASGVPGPYSVVLHEYAYNKLATAANIAGLANAGNLQIRNDIQNRFYVGSTGDMDFYTTGVLAAGGTVTQGIFGRRAVGYDIRKPITLTAEYRRDYRGVYCVLDHVYAGGAWRVDQGVQIISDATKPS